MAKEKKTKYVLLGFLLTESLSGYQLGRLIREATSHFWQESDASIYPTLKILAEEGLVSVEEAFVGRRRKEIFTITAQGREAFLGWFKREPEPDIHREEFLLKLFFTDDKTEAEMQKHREEKLAKMRAALKLFEETEKMLIKELPHKPYWLETLRIGLAHVELDIALLTQQIERRRQC
ncbi:PadR family transcriptional regulator [Estrella lausannensis]|uniref:Transcriptional regulator, PadR family n=1 Tax=Estrella lausannensis TaxID=483423 RepID=A0A0H5DPI9_9BACT|nr:helix-turn-helix transcriptional regulator [Estrella lausannensis]CRX37913.1 Transcriptional regulator, PadR family [Estrella lausannensis]